ncbi:hypothetical protein OK344_12240 [Kaistella sp. BT6-1-3]|uniref:Rhodanese domain-containing protein n=1 Tax=Kaistella yananensis TaxID=2989820 RepID=A0ABT3JQC2_9FLAO|nr:hypothetical protein [Kaistella yananensis]MCW4452972.1 hypothetical protein [Kaistella yananensis]
MNSICPSHLSSSGEDFLLLDIRERFEFNTYRRVFPNLKNIPFSEFDEELPTLDKSRKTLLTVTTDCAAEPPCSFLPKEASAMFPM